jgi:hypothetical protein
LLLLVVLFGLTFWIGRWAGDDPHRQRNRAARRSHVALKRGTQGTLAEGRRRADKASVITFAIAGLVVTALIALPLFKEESRRWDVARGIWVLLLLTMLPASFLVWLLGAYALCGTDTTEPLFGDGACDALSLGWGPISLWLGISLIPLFILVVGGLASFRREGWPLFALSTIMPPVLLVLAVVVSDLGE